MTTPTDHTMMQEQDINRASPADAGPGSREPSQQAVSAAGAASIPDAWRTLTEAMRDPDYAWSWHCNLAMPIMDAIGCSHEQANVAAAHLMQHLWQCDITTHPHYEHGKSGAQSYAEFRRDNDW